jgi:L,D-peptidoglycan transpeptidase YkuD (ErfK/YbiS/YcfS/YnhG family)
VRRIVAGGLVLVVLAAAVAVVAALTASPGAETRSQSGVAEDSRVASLSDRAAVPGGLTGVGPRMRAAIPSGTTQLVLVTGGATTSTSATIQLFHRSGKGWSGGTLWRGHTGARGWTTDHREGDLGTPVGVFTLSDTGGRKPDPGARLPYHRSDKFQPTGDGVYGDSLAGSFDYVIAVDYNRRRGTSPLDTTRPDGASRGGGIWLHVDHDGPTHGCVSVPAEGMKELLRELDPRSRPVVVMGDRASLAS